MLVCSILNKKLENLPFFCGGGGGGWGWGGGNSDFHGLHLHNGAKRQLPKDGVWRVVIVYYFRHCAILPSVSGYDISCLPWALSQK